MTTLYDGLLATILTLTMMHSYIATNVIQYKYEMAKAKELHNAGNDLEAVEHLRLATRYVL